MIDDDGWQELGEVLRANPVRTFLTMAGVFWGTFVLVLMLGFSDGLETAATRAVGSSGRNAVFVWGGRTRLPYRGLQPGRWVRYNLADLPVVQAIPGVASVAPRNQLGGYRDGTAVTRGTRSGAFQVMADVPLVKDVLAVEFDHGRFIDELDIRDGRKVAVIGREVQKALLPDVRDPVGEYIRIRGVWFQVVGTFHSPAGGDDGDRAEQTIHVPYTTFQRAFNTGDDVNWFVVTVEPEASAVQVEQDVKAALAARHRVHPDDAPRLGSFNSEQEFARVRNLFRGIRGLTWLVGAATLLSGAVGVSNVLMIVVRERTKEIGLRRAIGATKASIVRMIAFEAMVLTGLAGVLGLCAGVGVTAVVGVLVGTDNESLGPPRVDPWAAIVGLGLIGVAGLVASVLPARRAVAIEPVEALRTE